GAARGAVARRAPDPAQDAAHLGPRRPGAAVGQRVLHAQADAGRPAARVPALRALGATGAPRRVQPTRRHFPDGPLMQATVIAVCRVEDLPVGEARLVEVEPPIAVFNVDGVLYAIDDTCTHSQASLSEGDVDPIKCAVECPFHLARFDLRTGKHTP